MTMRLHTLKSAPGARKRRMRVGRGEGSGKGKTSGRGNKGQMARKGHKRKIGFEGGQIRLIRRLPKRGFKNPVRREFAVVNVGDLDRFDAGTEVTMELLRQVKMVKGVNDGIKLLGTGDLSKKLKVKAHAFSETARTKIEAVGGVCEVVA
jgi:large subunit ribosomal protein L15